MAHAALLQAIEAIKNRDAAIQQAGELLVAEKVRVPHRSRVGGRVGRAGYRAFWDTAPFQLRDSAAQGGATRCVMFCCNMLSEVAALERSATPALCFANPPQVRLAEKIESLKEKKEFLTAETTNNREIETQITAAERVQHK